MLSLGWRSRQSISPLNTQAIRWIRTKVKRTRPIKHKPPPGYEPNEKIIRNPYHEERLTESFQRLVKKGSLYTPETSTGRWLSINLNVGVKHKALDENLLKRYASRAKVILPECSLKEATVIINAFARARHFDEELLAVAATTLTARLSSSPAQGLAMISKTEIVAFQLYNFDKKTGDIKAIFMLAKEFWSSVNCYGVMNLFVSTFCAVYSFARFRSGETHRAFIQALLDEVPTKLPRFDVSEITLVSWCLGRLIRPSDAPVILPEIEIVTSFVFSSADEVMRTRKKFRADQLATIANGFGAVKFCSLPLWEAISQNLRDSWTMRQCADHTVSPTKLEPSTRDALNFLRAAYRSRLLYDPEITDEIFTAAAYFATKTAVDWGYVIENTRPVTWLPVLEPILFLGSADRTAGRIPSNIVVEVTSKYFQAALKILPYLDTSQLILLTHIAMWAPPDDKNVQSVVKLLVETILNKNVDFDCGGLTVMVKCFTRFRYREIPLVKMLLQQIMQKKNALSVSQTALLIDCLGKWGVRSKVIVNALASTIAVRLPLISMKDSLNILRGLRLMGYFEEIVSSEIRLAGPAIADSQINALTLGCIKYIQTQAAVRDEVQGQSYRKQLKNELWTIQRILAANSQSLDVLKSAITNAIEKLAPTKHQALPPLVPASDIFKS